MTTRARLALAGLLAVSSGAMDDLAVRAVRGSVSAEQPRASRVRRRLGLDPLHFVSEPRMFEALETLAALGSENLVRTSASAGERAAFKVVENWLRELPHLEALGLEVDRQAFRTAIGQEVRETRLFLTIDGAEVEVPAHALQGHRDDLERAMRFDSDGTLNDDHPDPIERDGDPYQVSEAAQIAPVAAGAARGRVVLLDYAVVDRSLLGTETATARAESVLAGRPAAVVLVTTFSNTVGESHGSFAGDLSAFSLAAGGAAVPTVYARLKDMAGAGIANWGDLASVRRVRLRWDSDVRAPGASQLLLATIPGADRSAVVVLGAHLDSPNSPGTLDDGSGSVTLLEVARAIADARYRPPIDVVLVWFGSHERGLFGSTEFLAAHSELLDRAVAMLQIDCLSVVLDGLQPRLTARTWTYGRFGNPSPVFPQFLAAALLPLGIDLLPIGAFGFASDNSAFTTFDVPNANLGYFDPQTQVEVHYAGHLHDPYDTPALAARELATLGQMARVALTATTQLSHLRPELRVTPPPQHRAVFVASHTEAAHMTGPAFVDFGMALAWEGYDLDVIPFGTPVTAAAIAGAAMVIALPVHDYPSPAGDLTVYDEEWTAAEIDVLADYAAGGGLLVLTNARRRMKYLNFLYEDNEDWPDAAALGGRFGVSWSGAVLPGTAATTVGIHPLVQGIARLAMAPGNGVGFTVPGSQVLARAGSAPVLALRPYGSGHVVIMADLGMFGTPADAAPNTGFFLNLARWARAR